MDIQIKAYLDSLPPDQRQIVEQLRRIIKKALPKVREEFKWGMPWYSPVCYIMRAKEHISLGFAHGGLIKDADKYFDGKGNHMRHLKLHSPDDIQPALFARLLKASEKAGDKYRRQKSKTNPWRKRNE